MIGPPERILWQGRPAGNARPDVSRPGQIVIGAGFVAVSLFWMDQAMARGPIWLAGLPFLATGLRLVLWRVWGPRLRAKMAHYTLTDRRALTELRWPLVGSRWQAVEIGPATMVEPSGDPMTLTLQNRSAPPLLFERLDDGPEVLALIRQVQRARAGDPA